MKDRRLGIAITVILLIGSACKDDSNVQTPAQLIAETDDACCPSPESVLANQMRQDDDMEMGSGVATASLIRDGQGLYNRHGCAVCHGGNGRGDGPVATTLRPQPRDFRDPSAYTNGKTVKSIAKSINWGVASSASVMPAFPHIPGDDRVKIAYYINSLQDQVSEDR